MKTSEDLYQEREKRFYDAVSLKKPDRVPEVVGLSGLLTLAFDSMKKTIDVITESGLRDRVKIMIGGSCVDDHIRIHAGADAYGHDAMEAVAYAKKWMGGK